MRIWGGIVLVLLATACSSSPAARVSTDHDSTGVPVSSSSPPTTFARSSVLVSPPSSGDPAPAEPVYGSTRADVTPGSSHDVAAARSDPHNPDLNKVLAALELRHVFLKTTPAETGRSASTEVYFDLTQAPYVGRLVLFSVRPGGGALPGTVTGLNLVTVRIEKGRVVGLEMNDGGVFTPDDPSAVPSSVPSSD